MSNANVVDEMFDEMLEETAKACSKEEEKVEEEKVEEVRKETKDILQGFLKYIRSIRFEKKIDNMSKTYQLDKKIVRNHFIKKILGKIADILHLAIAITAEIIKYVAEFISAIINKVVEFSYSVCTNLINLFTLNCGTV